MIIDGKPILDACCGSRMFWFDKDNPFVEFMDIRDEDVYLSDGQLVMVHPNTIGDFTNMPYPDNSFKMVVFDPPLDKRKAALRPQARQNLLGGLHEISKTITPCPQNSQSTTSLAKSKSS